MSEHLWETWLIAAGVLGALELVTLDLIFAMLAAGALVGAVGAAASGSVVLSALLALVTAVALLGLLRPNILKRIHSAPSLQTGHHTLIGRQGLVIEEIGRQGVGRVKVDGQDWQARAYDEVAIPVGAAVDIIEITGATAFVMSLPELTNEENSSS